MDEGTEINSFSYCMSYHFFCDNELLNLHDESVETAYLKCFGKNVFCKCKQKSLEQI